MGHQGVALGLAGAQLLLRGQVPSPASSASAAAAAVASATDPPARTATGGRLAVLGAVQVLAHSLQLAQLLGFTCYRGGEKRLALVALISM